MLPRLERLIFEAADDGKGDTRSIVQALCVQEDGSAFMSPRLRLLSIKACAVDKADLLRFSKQRSQPQVINDDALDPLYSCTCRLTIENCDGLPDVDEVFIDKFQEACELDA
jgi:hypothetical protein